MFKLTLYVHLGRVIPSVEVSLLGVTHLYGKTFQVQGIHLWTTLIRDRDVEESRPVASIVLFVKLWKKQFWHMHVYVIEFLMKLTVICFENNIKSLLNVAKRIPLNGIGQCGIETHDIHR